MSSPAALATVTATIHDLLSDSIAPGVIVSTQSPSVARLDNTTDQINIFLYGIHYSPTFRNSPMPGIIKNGENAFPPMPLVLKYLVTAYGAGDDDISGQELLGQVMSLLHDHPLLGKTDIEGVPPDSDLHNQIEKVRITPDPLNLDDMSKLWTSFQSAEYHLSTGYEVSVVLIESERTATAALPVLKRGEGDQGASVVAAPAASLRGLRFPNQKPSAELGDVVTLLGENLSNTNTTVRFEHPLLSAPIDLPAIETQNSSEMQFQLPDSVADAEAGFKWPAGFYSVSLINQLPDQPLLKSNSVSMPLSPSIESIDPISAPAGNVVLTIECLPQIKPDQELSLLFSDRIISADTIVTPADPTAMSTLTFTVENALTKVNPYILRLRVDAADSIPVDFSGDVAAFADNQKVTIT